MFLSSTSKTSRRVSRTKRDDLRFTFREAKEVVKKNKTPVVGQRRARDGLKPKKIDIEETTRLLTRLGVSDEERSRFLSLCEICKVGKQELKRNSLLTLFGEEDGSQAACYAGASDEDDGISNGTFGIGRGGDRQRPRLFLRRTDSPDTHPSGGRKTTGRQFGSDRVYFITLLLNTSAGSFESNKTRRPDTVCISLPPATGTQHETTNTDQDRLANLILMKVYFVVRYIYKRLREEIKVAVAVNEPAHRFRYPAVVIAQQARRQDEALNTAQWFTMVKRKITRGESPYTRSLSEDYFVNIV